MTYGCTGTTLTSSTKARSTLCALSTRLCTSTTMIFHTTTTTSVYSRSTVIAMNTMSTASSALYASTTIISTIPTVTHTREATTMCYTMSMGEICMIPRTTTIVMPAMTASVCNIEMWTTEIEIVTMWIASIDAEMPIASLPPQWTIEIACCTECLILPIEKNISQILITMNPVVSKHIIVCINTQEIVEVNLVCSLILLFIKVKLIRHFICKEQSLLAGLFVTHSICRCEECAQKSDHCYYHLFHSCIYFIILLIIYNQKL